MATQYRIQGMLFKAKPTSRKNTKALEEQFKIQSEADTDKFEDYFEYLKVVTEPVGDASFEAIDIDELDARQVEQIVANFLPNEMRMFVPLTSS